MRYRWLPCCLSVLLACSSGQARFRVEPGSADSTDVLPDSDGRAVDESTTGWIVDDAMTEVRDSTPFQAWVDREQPGVSLRCEDGQITAYLITTPAVEGESETDENQAVRIALDSAPRC